MKLILIILLYLSIINITFAIPIPALVIGGDYILLAIPVVLGLFSTVYFYFRKHIFWINIYLLIFSIFLYFIHFYITEEIFFFEKEYFLFLVLVIILGLIYKFKKLNILNYLLVIFLIGINFFLVKIDYNLGKYISYINKFENIIGKEKINKVSIKDNFFVIYFNGYRKELVVSNCTEGANDSPLFFRKVIKDFDKHPLQNGMCIYGNHGDFEFNTMYKIITK